MIKVIKVNEEQSYPAKVFWLSKTLRNGWFGRGVKWRTSWKCSSFFPNRNEGKAPASWAAGPGQQVLGHGLEVHQVHHSTQRSEKCYHSSCLTVLGCKKPSTQRGGKRTLLRWGARSREALLVLIDKCKLGGSGSSPYSNKKIVPTGSAEWELNTRLAKAVLGCSPKGGKGSMKNVSWTPPPWAITFPSGNVTFSDALPVQENFSSAKLFRWTIPNNPYFWILTLNNIWSLTLPKHAKIMSI